MTAPMERSQRYDTILKMLKGRSPSESNSAEKKKMNSSSDDIIELPKLSYREEQHITHQFIDHKQQWQNSGNRDGKRNYDQSAKGWDRGANNKGWDRREDYKRNDRNDGRWGDRKNDRWNERKDDRRDDKRSYVRGDRYVDSKPDKRKRDDRESERNSNNKRRK